jgi:hypothetical protein
MVKTKTRAPIAANFPIRFILNFLLSHEIEVKSPFAYLFLLHIFTGESIAFRGDYGGDFSSFPGEIFDFSEWIFEKNLILGILIQ